MKVKILVCAAMIALSGCTSIGQAIGNAAQEFSSSTPDQVKTLGEALQAAKIITEAVDVYVNSVDADKATLIELRTLNAQVHSTLVALQAANANNQSILLATFNEALSAFIAYATNKGVAH